MASEETMEWFKRKQELGKQLPLRPRRSREERIAAEKKAELESQKRKEQATASEQLPVNKLPDVLDQ